MKIESGRRGDVSVAALDRLTDAGLAVFSIAYEVKAAIRERARQRLKAELEALDLLAPEPNHEDYVPGGTE